jgi:hypothetical protein
MGWSTVVLLGLAAASLAGCGGTAILPPAIEEDLSATCIRDGGRWYPDDSRAGYCEYEM